MRVTRITLSLITLTIGVGLYLLVKMQLDELEPRTFQATEEAMVDAAELLASLAATQIDDSGHFQPEIFRKAFDQAHRRILKAWIYEHLKQEVGMHCYITDDKGTVIFDSDGGARVGQNLMIYNDVHLTLEGKYGARSSREIKDDRNSAVLHVAAPIRHDGRIWGVLTVRKAQADVLPIVHRRERAIWWGTGLVGIGILCMILAVFLWQYRPISRLTQYTREIEQGKRPPLPKLGAGQEVNTLADALESMRESLEGRKYAERYVQTLTHEMKSPLAAICAAGELLDEKMPEADRKKFIENIRAEAGRAERLLNKLLELSAIEGRSRIDRAESLDFGELVRRAVEHAGPMAELANVTIGTKLPKAPVSLSGDSFILRAAVTNLLENAIDFSPAGGVVAINLTHTEKQALLTIDDRGPGVPDYARDKVFERFFSLRQLNNGRKGTGLGLTLVREAAILHKGSVHLEPREGGGTRASLILPAG